MEDSQYWDDQNAVPRRQDFEEGPGIQAGKLWAEALRI